MLERAKEVAGDGGWARGVRALLRRSGDLVDGHRRHAWLRVAEVAIASPAGAWILRNAETGRDVNFASLPGTGALAGRLCLRLQRPTMPDYVTLRQHTDGPTAAGGCSC